MHLIELFGIFIMCILKNNQTSILLNISFRLKNVRNFDFATAYKLQCRCVTVCYNIHYAIL